MDWPSTLVDAAANRAKRESPSGPNPVDRCKRGSKIHVQSDAAAGLPLVVTVPTANVHDSRAFSRS